MINVAAKKYIGGPVERNFWVCVYVRATSCPFDESEVQVEIDFKNCQIVCLANLLQVTRPTFGWNLDLRCSVWGWHQAPQISVV